MSVEDPKEPMENEVPSEEPTEEPTETPVETPAEPGDNSTRSRLGRKVALMEETLQDFMSRVENKIDTIGVPKTEVYNAPEEDDIVTTSTLRNQLNNFYEEQKRREAEVANSFRTGYTKSLLDLSKGMSDEEFNAVVEELDKSGNPKSANDPAVAAQINFLRARNSLLEKKVKTPVNPIKGKDNNLPTEVGGVSTNKSNEFVMPNLDPETMEFIKKSGLSDEDVKDALSNSSPTLAKG